jgi:hypothetical protein
MIAILIVKVDIDNTRGIVYEKKFSGKKIYAFNSLDKAISWVENYFKP